MQRVIVCGEGALAVAIARALRDGGLDVSAETNAFAIQPAPRIDALVTVPPEPAGPETILTTPEARFDDIIERHLTAIFLACKAVIPRLIENGGGAIVNVAYAAAYGQAHRFAESAGHGAIVAFGSALAYDHFHDHVRVNTVVAGDGATPEGIAPVVAFLLSAAADVMSGSIVDVGNVAYQGAR